MKKIYITIQVEGETNQTHQEIEVWNKDQFLEDLHMFISSKRTPIQRP